MKKFVFLAVAFSSLFAISHSSYAFPRPLEDWVVDRMVLWSPPGHSFFADARETTEEALARYHSIARDAVTVVYDPIEKPLFPGPYGRAKTMAVMLGIAVTESGGLRKDVDLGKGGRSKGDGGQSWCLMQIRLSEADSRGKTSKRIALDGPYFSYKYGTDGWGGEDLVEDRTRCFRVALHMMRKSYDMCNQLPVNERMSSYASGNCDDGRGASRLRMNKAISWLAQTAPPLSDETFQEMQETMHLSLAEVN